MKVMIGGPRIPTKVSIVIMKVGNDEAVEIGEVVVDPLLPCLNVGSEVSRQPLHRVEEARRANLGVPRGVAHRSARRWRKPRMRQPHAPLKPNALGRRGFLRFYKFFLLTRSTHPQDIFLAGLKLTPRLRAVEQGWRRGAVHCPRPTCASRAVF
eukprot:scaffold11734_cov115-Isochrysis_galbana.AAC.1